MNLSLVCIIVGTCLKFLKKIAKNLILTVVNLVSFRFFLRDECNIIFLSDGDRPTFFGYHDKSPFSGDDKLILATSIESNDIDFKNECTRMNLGYFVKDEIGAYKFIKFSETNAWSYQQGCMLQWNPSNSTKQVFYNCCVDGKYAAVLFDICDMRVIKTYPQPLYSISPCGKFYISLSFSSLNKFRPGYGYKIIEDSHSKMILVNVADSTQRVIFDLNHHKFVNNITNSDGYINHATFSPDSKHVVFFYVTVSDSSSRKVRVYSLNIVSLKLTLLEESMTVSHYCWVDSCHILAAAMDADRNWRFVKYDMHGRIEKYVDLLEFGDGHPMKSSLGEIYISDTYPNIFGYQKLYVVYENLEKKILALYFSPKIYRGYVRCDLHPRWNRSGTKVAVDTTCYGSRKISIISNIKIKNI